MRTRFVLILLALGFLLNSGYAIDTVAEEPLIKSLEFTEEQRALVLPEEPVIRFLEFAEEQKALTAAEEPLIESPELTEEQEALAATEEPLIEPPALTEEQEALAATEENIDTSDKTQPPKVVVSTLEGTVKIPEAAPEPLKELWFFEWRIHGTLTDQLYLYLRTDISNEFRGFQVRAQFPTHALWLKHNASAYPPEWPQDKLLNSFYQSQFYFNWWQNHSKFQFGSIQIHNASPWYSLRSSTVFPTSTKTINSLSSKPFVGYESELNLDQNLGLSWDGQWLHALLLHQRNNGAENLHAGLGLHFQNKDLEEDGHQFQLRSAIMLSQNLGKTSNENPWYFSHTGKKQNNSASKHWTQLLLLDQGLQQYHVQAGWSAQNEKAQLLKSKIHVGTEQSASLSPLDYLGIRQQYYLGFQFPIFYHKLDPSSERDFGIRLHNESFANYTDRNWVDARRKLASSKTAQFYGQRFNLTSQNTLHFFIKQDSSRTHEQLYRLKFQVKTPRFLQDTQKSYSNWLAKYYLLWRKSYLDQRPNSLWALSFTLGLDENMPTTGTIDLDATTWNRKLEAELSWQQKPPTRIPEQDNARSSILGWKAKLGGKDSKRSGPLSFGGSEDFQTQLQTAVFIAIWKYGDFSLSADEDIRWWKFFQLQLDLSLRFTSKSSTTTQLSNVLLISKMHMLLQMTPNWQFRISLELDALSFTQQKVKKVSLGFSIRYQFQKSSKRQSATLDNPDDDIEEQLEEGFQTEEEEAED